MNQKVFASLGALTVLCEKSRFISKSNKSIYTILHDVFIYLCIRTNKLQRLDKRERLLVGQTDARTYMYTDRELLHLQCTCIGLPVNGIRDFSTRSQKQSCLYFCSDVDRFLNSTPTTRNALTRGRQSSTRWSVICTLKETLEEDD